jgi:transcriptional regulator GlxA family with amidase domain
VTDGFGRGGAKEQKAMGAMQILLADILEKIGVPFGGVPKFERVLEHIEQHYSESITVSSLAKMMGLSTVYFSSSFKEIFHVSPKQYILSKRLFESRILLMQTDLSIGEIAHAVGFENENYFSEFFSQKVGISALGFRHAAQKKR